jgi:DNA-binding transcriptional regulator YiaG
MDAYRGCGVPLLNIKEGGNNGKLSLEMRAHLSMKHKGKKCSPESIEKRRVAMIGRKATEETKRKLSEAHKAKNYSETRSHDFTQGENNGASKLNAEKITELRERYGNGTTIGELSKSFGISWANVSLIINGKGWSHIPISKELSERIEQRRCENRVSNSAKMAGVSIKLTPEQVAQIKQKFIPREYTYPMLAKEYGVSIGTINNILNPRVQIVKP